MDHQKESGTVPEVPKQTASLKRGIGYFSLIAIVIGEMIGSGIYKLPSELAKAGKPIFTVLALLITGLGTIFLALSFAKLGRSDGQNRSVIVYTQEALGDVPAFWIGWIYWCGCWLANGAIVIAGLDYASYFFPVLSGSTNSFWRFGICIAILWFYTIVDIYNVKHAGILNLVLTILKILPLLIFACVAAFHFSPANFTSSAPDVASGFPAVSAAMGSTLWCFLGFESASVNSDEVTDQKKIGRATIIGTAVTVVIYVILMVLAAGGLSQETLVTSDSPMADVMEAVTGNHLAGAFIAIGGMISVFGCIGPWVLSGGNIAYSLSSKQLLPAAFGKVSEKHGTPFFALLFNGVMMTIVMFLGWATRGGNVYSDLTVVATMGYSVVYAFGSISEIVLASKKVRPFSFGRFLKCSLISLIGFTYAIYTIYGSKDYVLFGFLLMMLGLPIFVYVRANAQAKAERTTPVSTGKQ